MEVKRSFLGRESLQAPEVRGTDASRRKGTPRPSPPVADTPSAPRPRLDRVLALKASSSKAWPSALLMEFLLTVASPDWMGLAWRPAWLVPLVP